MDLAGQLDKVVGRYQQVSSALCAYVPDLEQAQAWSLQALNQAEGPYQQQQSLQAQTMPSGSNLTARPAAADLRAPHRADPGR